MKKRWSKLFFLLVLILILGIGIVVFLRYDAVSYEIYESQYTLNNGYTFTNIQVCGMRDKELEKKINENLNSCFYILVEPWFAKDNVVAFEPIIHCQTSRYLSVEYVWDYLPASVESYIFWHLCVTLDMQTGEVVYLDDLIEVDEDFAMLIKNDAILKVDGVENLYTSEETTKYENDYFSKRDVPMILSFFRTFTKDYLYGDFYRNNEHTLVDWEVSLYYDYFYLEEGTICFKSPNSSDTGIGGARIIKIKLEDIEDNLKVSKW